MWPFSYCHFFGEKCSQQEDSVFFKWIFTDRKSLYMFKTFALVHSVIGVMPQYETFTYFLFMTPPPLHKYFVSLGPFHTAT